MRGGGEGCSDLEGRDLLERLDGDAQLRRGGGSTLCADGNLSVRRAREAVFAVGVSAAGARVAIDPMRRNSELGKGD